MTDLHENDDYNRGYEDGEIAGREKATAEIQQLQERLDKIHFETRFVSPRIEEIRRLADRVTVSDKQPIPPTLSDDLCAMRDAAADKQQECDHDWELIGEHEQYALHGPNEVGDPGTIYGWKCLLCEVVENTLTGEPPKGTGLSENAETGNHSVRPTAVDRRERDDG